MDRCSPCGETSTSSTSTRCGKPHQSLCNKSLEKCAFPRMAVFVWCLFSSAVIYSAAAVLAFAALRKHSLGRYLMDLVLYGFTFFFSLRFYSVMILVMGLIIPLSLGLLSSGAIAFVYKHSNFSMVSLAKEFPTSKLIT